MEAQQQASSLLSRDTQLFLKRILDPHITIMPRNALLLFVLALFMGLLTDVLFEDAKLGANVPIWCASLTVALLLAGHVLRTTFSAERVALLLVSLAAAMVLAWRDSNTLRVFFLACTAGTLLLALALPAGLSLRRISPLHVAIALAAGIVALGSATWRLATFIHFRERLGRAHSSDVALVGRAFLIAAPIFLTFGGLFFAADSVFAAHVERAAQIDLSSVWSHVLRFLAGSWTASAALWSACVVQPAGEFSAEMPEQRRLRPFEVGIILAPLALLFVLFVIIQVRYLFGGAEMVQRSIDLTYSEYARRGFFELVIASLLLLPVLTALNWSRRRGPASLYLFASLAVILVVLLAIVMASAWQRLAIYLDAFGLTELRFYAASTLPWLAVTFVWFLLVVALQRRAEFLAGALLAAVAVLLLLSVFNPDAFIVRTNLERAGTGRAFDAEYAASLSADSVPHLITHLGELRPAERCQVAQSLLQRWSQKEADLRSWNWSRQRATQFVAGNRVLLEGACS